MRAEPTEASATNAAESPPAATAAVDAPLRRWRGGRLLCWALFALLLTGSGWATWASYQLMQQRRADAFAAQTSLLKLRFEDRLDLYRNLSRTLLAYFQASHSVAQRDWRNYVLAQQLDRHYPFLHRVWFAFDMDNPVAEDYLQQRPTTAANGSPPWPWHLQDGHPVTRLALAQDRRLPLLYVYPADAALSGFDVYADGGATVERAYALRDTVLSADFDVLPDDDDRSFTFVTPLFRQAELAASATPALEGVIGVCFSADRLFQRLLDDAPPDLSLEVYRGHRLDPGQRLFDADGVALADYERPPHHLREIRVEYDSEPLTLVFHAPRFWSVAGIDDFAPWYVAGSGLLISLLGFAIASALENTRARATSLAEKMTLDLRDANAVLARMATTDSLTGLLNRRAFVDRLEAELLRVGRYPEACALLMFDIDHFKQINDTHGHPAGDLVLRAVGQLLRLELRSVDAAGRMGGEEFAVLLPHTGSSEALVVAEQLRVSMERQRHHEGGVEFGCTASFGVVSSSDLPGASAEDLLRQADRALYRAKAGGRNRVEGSRNERAKPAA